MVIETSNSNHFDDSPDEPDSVIEFNFPKGQAGGPSIDQDAIAELAIYMRAHCSDTSEEERMFAESIVREKVDATWKLVMEYTDWRSAYVAEKLRLLKSSNG